ncbi:MAG: SDR family oxidoreductase [Elusimicrobia bacterium]|nr:SDR family oxidoreductase [Elusimicrobiota bacterium]
MRTIKSLSDLSGRVALVTGGAGHIGMAMGAALVEAGGRVCILDADQSACAQTAEILEKIRPQSVFFVAADLSREKDVRRAIREVQEKAGLIDILIHCAAYVGTTEIPGWAVPFEEQTTDAWRQAMEVNATSAFIMVQEAKKSLEASGHGSVILIGSIYGFLGPNWKLYEGTSMSNPAGYGASKGALMQLTRYLATTLAPKIRVNAISPGGVWRQQPDVFRARYEERTPLQRMATEEDFKGACLYLASDLSAYVTGQNLIVDGGWSAW